MTFNIFKNFFSKFKKKKPDDPFVKNSPVVDELIDEHVQEDSFRLVTGTLGNLEDSTISFNKSLQYRKEYSQKKNWSKWKKRR